MVTTNYKFIFEVIELTSKAKYFVKGLIGDQLNPIKREKMFIDMLESVHPKDAELLLAMKDKKILAKSVTRKLIQEAFPNLIVK